MLQHIQASTYHSRHGSTKNAFGYDVDFVLSDLQKSDTTLFSRNRFNLWSIWDYRHGGVRDQGIGLDWFKHQLSARDFDFNDTQLLLLTQPSFLWFHFNPVSFWIALRNNKPVAFIAEVNNTFGHRHCYFCANDGFTPIKKSQTIVAEKLMHVSPFQKVKGQYSFNFGFSDDSIDIRINYKNDNHGVLATLIGKRKTASSTSLLKAAIIRPFGALRVVALIHFQALALYIKRAPFTKPPKPPSLLISNGRALRKHSDD